MVIDYVTHDEAIIQHFIEDPDFANLYLQTVLEDGNAEEIERVLSWYEEAKNRTKAHAPNMVYWNSVANNAKLAVKNGNNLAAIFNVLNDALATVKAAMA